jgi:hypothetical protein
MQVRFTGKREVPQACLIIPADVVVFAYKNSNSTSLVYSAIVVLRFYGFYPEVI